MGGGGGISNRSLIKAPDNNRKLLKDSGSCSQMERVYNWCTALNTLTLKLSDLFLYLYFNDAIMKMSYWNLVLKFFCSV